MLKRFTQLAGLTSILGLLAVPAAQASTHISVQIGTPAPLVAAYPVRPAPYAGYFWRPGHYVRTRFGYQWVPGAWIRPSYARPGVRFEQWERERRDGDRDDRNWRGDRDRDRRDRDRDNREHWRR